MRREERNNNTKRRNKIRREWRNKIVREGRSKIRSKGRNNIRKRGRNAEELALGLNALRNPRKDYGRHHTYESGITPRGDRAGGMKAWDPHSKRSLFSLWRFSFLSSSSILLPSCSSTLFLLLFFYHYSLPLPFSLSSSSSSCVSQYHGEMRNAKVGIAWHSVCRDMAFRVARLKQVL